MSADCAEAQYRTGDLSLFRRALYQLSYLGILFECYQSRRFCRLSDRLRVGAELPRRKILLERIRPSDSGRLGHARHSSVTYPLLQAELVTISFEEVADGAELACRVLYTFYISFKSAIDSLYLLHIRLDKVVRAYRKTDDNNPV